MKGSILVVEGLLLCRARLFSYLLDFEVQVRDGRVGLLDYVINTKLGCIILLSSGR